MSTEINKEEYFVRTADQLEKGEKNRIQGFTSEGLSSKFLELGILPENPIALVRYGPGRNTMYLKVNGHYYAIRKEEAAQIILKF
ncbi:MAG TPA: ferrous iron transport protein A [Flavobacteriales bacterium]|jgi:Fe2+ transport system protein FeoA|nr:ferrous iron transport protein A [Flavobacteriales bacterium]